MRYAGGGQIITLNRGSDEGLTIGDVVQLLHTGATVLDRTAAKREFIKLPDEPIGLAFVFRTFPAISYALILRGTKAVVVGDRASNPLDSLDITDTSALASGVTPDMLTPDQQQPNPKR